MFHRNYAKGIHLADMRIYFEKNGEFHAKAPIDPNDIYDVNEKCTCKPGYVIEFNDNGGQCVRPRSNE